MDIKSLAGLRITWMACKLTDFVLFLRVKP